MTSDRNGWGMKRNGLAVWAAALWVAATGVAGAQVDLLPGSAAGNARSGFAEGYRKECGSCHMAYPPQFLPERSWKKIMNGLADHFGENAELPADDARAIESFLISNASDHTWSRLRTIARWVRDDEVPLRVSLLPYFVAKHKQVPERMVQGNPAVRSISRCSECHRKAETQDSYDDHDIDIPGFGHWEEDDEE